LQQTVIANGELQKLDEARFNRRIADRQSFESHNYGQHVYIEECAEFQRGRQITPLFPRTKNRDN